MRLPKAIILSLALFALAACDTFNRVFLVNTTESPVTIISNIEINSGNPTLLKLVEESNGQFVHELEANSEYVLAAEIDTPVTAETFPCDTLIILSARDTIRHNSKEEIFSALTVISDERMELRIDQ